MADDSNDNRTKSFVALKAGTKILHYKIISKLGAGSKYSLSKALSLTEWCADIFPFSHLSGRRLLTCKYRSAAPALGQDYNLLLFVVQLSQFTQNAQSAVAGRQLTNLFQSLLISLKLFL